MNVFKATKTLDGYLPQLALTEDKSQADILLVGGKRIEIDKFPSLKGIFKTGVGTDNLPYSAARERGIEIALPSESTQAIIFEETAAFTCHLILQGLFADSAEWDSWTKKDRNSLRQQRLLVVGSGRIGLRVAEKMRAFMVVDTYDSAHDPIDSFKSKVESANCVSLHIPLTAETRNLFDAEKLGWLRDGALLVNTARGPIIDEEALYSELVSERIRAAIDVFWEEPYHGILNNLPTVRIIKTPHIASTCREFIQSTATDFLQFIDRISNSQEKLND
ncbi:hydroxyacid dehydrogenase [Gammaproteobacteria bacterium]|nr:hydroxyacid dehydrogenase [Gammaproteobacteria bacterium]